MAGPSAGSSIRRFRSKQHHVNERALFETWGALVGFDADWSWDGSHFPKTAKCGSANSDRDILAKTSPALSCVLELVPNAFATSKSLARVLQTMDIEHDIFAESAEKAKNGQQTCCIVAADNWKRMLNELVGLKRFDAQVASPQLQKLIDAIVLDRPSTSPSVSPRVEVDGDGYPIVHDDADQQHQQHQQHQQQQSQQQLQNPDDDDLQFVSERCGCRSCNQMRRPVIPLLDL